MTSVREPKPTKADGGLRVDVIEQRGKYTTLGYRSAATAQREGRTYNPGSADYHLEYARSQLINQSRAFYRNNLIYKGLIDRAVSYIVGRGFGLRVLSGSAKSGQAMELAWRNWYRQPDIRCLLTGARATAMICREAMLCGDTAAIKRNGGQLQFVEAEQITTGRGAGTGIELDDDGKPQSFRVCPYGQQGQIATMKGKSVDAGHVLFFTTPGRPSQTRGEPVLQSVFAMLDRISDVCDSEALAWQILSRLAISVTREEGDQRGFAESIEDPNKPNADTTGDVAARMIELDSAIIFNARPGEKAEGIARNIPGENFTESLRMFMRLLGLPLGMPLELILLDWSQANYSQSRAVLEQAFQTFCDWQDALVFYYYEPLFRWQLPLLRRAGALPADAEVTIEWIMPTFPWIDKLKEAQANGVKLDRCLTTHAHVLKEIGLDRESVVQAREREIIDAIKRAQKITNRTGVPVPWELFAGLQAPKAESPAGLKEKAKHDENLTDEETDDA